MNGKIDLIGEIHTPIVSDDDGKSEPTGKDEKVNKSIPDIFTPTKLLESLARKKPQQYAKINK